MRLLRRLIIDEISAYSGSFSSVLAFFMRATFVLLPCEILSLTCVHREGSNARTGAPIEPLQRHGGYGVVVDGGLQRGATYLA